MKDRALYNVSLKVIIRRDDKFLVLTNSENKFDLPGGRIDIDENKDSLEKIIDREIVEELGVDMKIEMKNPVMCFRRIFDEDNLNVFIVVFYGRFISGSVSVSNEHDGYVWMKPEEIIADPNKFYSEEEYLSFRNFLVS